MRTTHAAGRRKSAATRVLLSVGLFAVVGAAALATMWGAGWIHFPWEGRNQIPAGWVAVPVSARTIPAYTKMTRDYIINPKTMTLEFIYLPPGAVTPEMITDFNKVFGRVLNHEKPAGYAFTEKDFEPKGTRDGIEAGIPAGKRSLTFEATKLEGVFGLKEGDHIDLVATIPIDATHGLGGNSGGMSSVMNVEAKMANMQKRAAVRVLAQDAVLVTPVTTRVKPMTTGSLTQGTQVRAVPVQEVVIAVDPAEVAPISEALATNVAITCIARSGLPTDPGPASKTPGADPLSDYKVVDAISGKSRQALLFSSDGARLPTAVPADSPTAAAAPADTGSESSTVQPASAVAPAGK